MIAKVQIPKAQEAYHGFVNPPREACCKYHLKDPDTGRKYTVDASPFGAVKYQEVGRKKISEETEAKIVLMYRNREPTVTICNSMRITSGTLTRILLRNKIPMRRPQMVKLKTK